MNKEFWYLGSPYSKYPGGLKAAFTEVCRIAGEFARAGIPVYSPIAHTHPIAEHGALNPLDHNIWMAFDAPLMAAAHGLIVARMDGWETSFGLRQEIAYFQKAGKPIRHFDPSKTFDEQEGL